MELHDLLKKRRRLVVGVVGQTIGSTSSETPACDCLCTLEVGTVTIIGPGCEYSSLSVIVIGPGCEHSLFYTAVPVGAQLVSTAAYGDAPLPAHPSRRHSIFPIHPLPIQPCRHSILPIHPLPIQGIFCYILCYLYICPYIALGILCYLYMFPIVFQVLISYVQI